MGLLIIHVCESRFLIMSAAFCMYHFAMCDIHSSLNCI